MESVLRAEALLAVEGFEAERRERAAQLREVLDGAGRPLSPNEVSAAQGLLDLGFPYAFELSPEELFALRESQRGSGLWISVLAAFAVPWVVTCGLLNALYAMEQLVRMGGGHCGMVSFAIGAGSAVIAVAAGYDAFRLAYRSIDHGQSAQRLMGWSLAARPDCESRSAERTKKGGRR